MDETTAEKLAGLLADCAATGNTDELVKQADFKQLLFPLVGAGIGGASGYMLTDKEKDKHRNALYGALTGGLSGAGAQLAAPLVSDWWNSVTNKSDASTTTPTIDSVTKPTGEPIKPKTPTGTDVAGPAGGVGGAIAGWLTRKKFDTPLEAATKLTTGAGKGSKAHPAADFFKKLFEAKQLGTPAADLLPKQPGLAAGTAHPSLEPLKNFISRGGDVKKLADPKIRQALEDAYKHLNKSTRGPTTLPTGTMLELMRLQSSRPGIVMRTLRGAGRAGVGGFAGSYAGDWVYRTLANMLSGDKPGAKTE
jgi:hypothetical protein